MGSFNGYRLLNEVGTGGTLSSLFSILSLFTEDVELSWGATPPRSGLDTPGPDVPVMSPTALDEEEEAARMAKFRDRGRHNSDVSQLDGDLGKGLQSPALSPSERGPEASRKRSSSLSTDRGSVTEHGRSPPPADMSNGSSSLPPTKSPSPVEPLSPPLMKRSQSSREAHREDTILPSRKESGSKSHQPSLHQRKATNAGIHQMHGTVARATADTTLAVIPSEAFRKLTRKFPKASGTVVQVVLERFSRVTFMTAHKFLGLMREILRSESSLNELVSYPLPRSFYTGDGMTALRARFQQQSEAEHQRSDSLDASPTVSMKKGDYFNYVPSSPTVRAPSLPSVTPKSATTPAAKLGTFAPLEPITVQGEGGSPEKSGTPQSAMSPSLGARHVEHAARVALTAETSVRHTNTFIRRVSGMRKQVAPGDLAVSPVDVSDKGGAYFRHPSRTPGLSRMETWRGRYAGSSLDVRQYAGEAINSPEDDEQVYELRDAVMLCIAKSIGLAQPPPPAKDASVAPSVSAFSTPNSPMFPPNGSTGATKSPFGNVLDMMTAQTHNESVLGGMLREAVMNRGMDDDASSVSMSVHESGFRDGADIKHILKDLEGKVEILHFAKRDKLVSAGERSPGIYYVIDGFLDVSPGRDPGHFS